MTTEARKSAAQTIRSQRLYRRVSHTRRAHSVILRDAYKMASDRASAARSEGRWFADTESEAASIILNIIGRR